jgi:hypothetical protein
MRPLVLALLVGCAPTLVGRAHDQNPLGKPDHVSEGIAIATKDAQIIANAGAAVDPASHSRPNTSGYASTGAQYYHPTFYQSAIFEVKGTEELVFLVELANRWPELTHAENYDIRLENDRGQVFHPADIRGQRAHVVLASMTLGRSDVVHMTVRTLGGQWMSFHHAEPESGADGRTMLAARSLVEFRAPGLLTKDTRRLTLHLSAKGRSLEFVWEFE